MCLKSKVHELVTLQLTLPPLLAPTQSPHGEMGADMLSPVALALLPTQALAREQVPTFLIKLGHILPGWDAKEPCQQVEEVSSSTMEETKI